VSAGLVVIRAFSAAADSARSHAGTDGCDRVLVRLPVIFLWELLKPPSFHERPFDRARWRSFQSYEVANERGQMYDDLIARGLVGPLTVEKRVLAVLGPPDERSSTRLYWLTGRWHSDGDTCLVVEERQFAGTAW
jgi:hypothetical protein